MGNINIYVEGKKTSCPEGTILQELAEQYQSQRNEPIMVARCDGVIQELYHEVYEGEHVHFVTTREYDGKRVYLRGVSMLLMKAINSLFDKEMIQKVSIDYSLDTGYYCRIHSDSFDLDGNLKKIEEKMYEYVKDDILFEKQVIPTRQAKELFENLGMPQKSLLCKFRRNSRMTIYKLGNYIDYFYGAMPYSTGVLTLFELKKFEDGFVFVLPLRKDGFQIPEFRPSMKLYRTMQQTNEWGEKLHITTVGELNEEIVKGNLRELMMTQEALHEKRIGDIAEQIAEKGSRVVTIAGPSSSGKTTFSYRLSTQLKTLGLRPHPIALDDYFVNREDTPVGPDGKYNYECLEALDIKTLNENLSDLLAGKEVQLPTYNFITGCREYMKPKMKIEPDEILILEGIHGLNNKLTYSIPDEDRFKIYISALTTLNLDSHNRIPTTEARLIRRIIRDNRTRGNTAQNTISMWQSVRAGEAQNIFPFQEEADAMFNSALIYELAALKLFADPVLFQVPKEAEEYSEAQRILKFLDYFLPIDPREVPLNSILREFIGGGILLN